MKTRLVLVALLAPALSLVAGCKKDEQEPLTLAEATQAVEEASIAGEAQNLTSGSIELSTNFTLGQAAEAAAEELRDFVTSQLACAEITLEGATLTVEYGAKPGNCTYKGQTFSGTHVVTLSKTDENDVLVQHEWHDFSNGRVKVNGTADVTWSFTNQTRHEVHELTWTRLLDGKTGTGTADVTHGVLEGGLAEGITANGSRSWVGQSGRWDLAIEDVEMRWIDPVPQAGTYRLATPKGKSLSMSFSRLDADTIVVTVASGGKSFEVKVNSLKGDGAS